MAKKIISIGYEIPGHSDLYHAYSSDSSLLDADLVIFVPKFHSYHLDPYDGQHAGKPLYDENDSFRLKEDTRHWKRELSTSLEAGKTVFVFFVQFREFYVATGDTQYSGPGKNARATRTVASYDNYQFFPVELGKIIPRGGDSIVFNGAPTFSSFWDEFKDDLKYESYIDGTVREPLFYTKTGNKVVGALFRVGRGNLVLLPAVAFDRDAFIKITAKEGTHWTKEGIQFGKRLIQALVDIDKALRAGGERTPPPQWLADGGYTLAAEAELKGQIETASKQIDALVTQRNALTTKLDDEIALKDLLFEKGKRLENAILLGLKILGYHAENYNDGTLELDQVIKSPEGDRFIGEAEGKDATAINIDKLRQLVTNIHEDMRRDDVSESARGILFGNGYRLTEPSDRSDQFTDKCKQFANQSNHTLITTAELFRAAKYIQESGDADYARACRDCIKNGRGIIITFPAIPV